MGKEKYYQYFVEGEDEKKLVDVLKSDMKLIVSGKSQVFNVTQQKLMRLRVMNAICMCLTLILPLCNR